MTHIGGQTRFCLVNRGQVAPNRSTEFGTYLLDSAARIAAPRRNMIAGMNIANRVVVNKDRVNMEAT